jgi:hypothetical protein
MRSSKPYTNVTFTKRVDHEAGRHHTARAASEPRVCTSCGAVYLRRRWRPRADPQAVVVRASGAATPTTCPACRTQRSGVPSGYVTITGQFAREHVQDIERLLVNEANRAAEDNPLARILHIDRSKPGAIEVTTTTEHLAERLGRALHSAFHGDVSFDFSHENKLARVKWSRD